MKRRDYNWYHRNTKDRKKLLQRTVCQEIWKPKWNEQISRKCNLPKLNEEEAKNLNRPVTVDEI